MVGHDRPLKSESVAPAGFGLVTIDQLVPSQCSVNVLSPALLEENATAKQFDVPGHDTPVRSDSIAPLTLALGTTDQLVPFQCSANVSPTEPFRYSPTALQLVVLGHDTPDRTESVVPAGLGLVTIDQLVPSQCSTNVAVTASGEPPDP